MKPLCLVYVAGPLTSPVPAHNTHAAIRSADELWDTGLIAPIVPHLSELWNTVTPRSYEEWLDYDLQIVRRCDAVYRLEGESEGADREVEAATSWGIPVFFNKKALLIWAEAHKAHTDRFA